MLKYTTEQIASLISLPIIIILLSWTVVIFHKNRKKWNPYDIPIVSVLILSILRNFTILFYLITLILNFNEFNTEYCSLVTWIFNSIHTFQASNLTSIAVIGLFAAKLHRKHQSLRTFLTSTHIIYHLFCLTTLCACVGVAAILAQKEALIDNDFSLCKFLPFELDIKFNVFIIVLHVFLASISLICFLMICYNYYLIKKDGFEYIKKSNSDLSELSNNYHGINTNVNETRNFFDTYTINRNNKDSWSNRNSHHHHHHNLNNSEILSNNSTTVSSTNSRKPCLKPHHQEDEDEEIEDRRTGLETMHPVLIVCYLFYHLPLIVLSICPRLIYPWSVAGIALWLGLIQDLLIPIGLAIVDSRFCSWVSEVYKCKAKRTEEKLPQVGLDGKFRPFGLSTSPPQTLDLPPHSDSGKHLQQIEHRFPITNGSLYTSIDGRLPVIHNYRRHHKEFRTVYLGSLHHQDMQSSNVALHSSHLHHNNNKRDFPDQKFSSCPHCAMNHQCPSHSDLHHLSPHHQHHHIQRKLSFLQASQNNVFASSNNNNGERKIQHHDYQNCVFVGNRRLQMTQNSLQRNQIRLFEANRQKPTNNKKISHSQESINNLYFATDDGNGSNNNKISVDNNIYYHNSELNLSSPSFNLINNKEEMVKNSRNLLRLNKLRLSRSEDSLADIHQVEIISQNNKPVINNSFIKHVQPKDECSSSSSSDDEVEDFFNNAVKEYDSMSSCNSITTEANCDFEFFQTKPNNNNTNLLYGNNNNNNNKEQKLKHVSQTKITRSNSRRSLENFQTFIEETCLSNENNKNISKIVILHRSNSYTTLEDRNKKKRKIVCNNSDNKNKLIIGNSKVEHEQIINLKPKKIKSMEYLPNNNNNAIIYKEDFKNNNLKISVGNSSVPDFKKVFVSDYI